MVLSFQMLADARAHYPYNEVTAETYQAMEEAGINFADYPLLVPPTWGQSNRPSAFVGTGFGLREQKP